MKQENRAAKNNIFVKFWRVLAITDSLRIGLITFLPIAIFLLFGGMVLGIINDKGNALLRVFLPPERLFPYSGALFVLLASYLIGRWLAFEQRSGKYFLYRGLQKIPFLGKLLAPRAKEKILQPCLFWQTHTVLSLGVISGIQTIKGLPERKVIVSTINPPPAPVFLLEKRYVIQLGIKFEEALQMSTSYGMSHPGTLKPLPWEEETLEECLERIKRCPE